MSWQSAFLRNRSEAWDSALSRLEAFAGTPGWRYHAGCVAVGSLLLVGVLTDPASRAPDSPSWTALGGAVLLLALCFSAAGPLVAALKPVFVLLGRLSAGVLAWSCILGVLARAHYLGEGYLLARHGWPDSAS